MSRLMLVIALVLMPLPTLGQSALPSTDAELQQRIRQKKVIVQPRPSADAVTGDANEAIDHVGARARQQERFRELRQPMPRRPDLNENVTGGIQTRDLNSVRPR